MWFFVIIFLSPLWVPISIIFLFFSFLILGSTVLAIFILVLYGLLSIMQFLYKLHFKLAAGRTETINEVTKELSGFSKWRFLRLLVKRIYGNIKNGL